ncbi:penicillin-binding transpeptidase domain-containing protein [Haloglycomyces albus]|uniref:penicillin-binding transpeptidase domain-containing protein n=1 Tax=Haloglycomyces albus TaxID=526067 RepID=UPI00046CB492|nr:penicillin-binding transpeptidase domain-containing protein [Haloglycomyces albus]
MNPTLRRTAILSLVLFAALFIHINRIQFFGLYAQDDNGWCTVEDDDYEHPRGSILAGDTPIAESMETEDDSYLDYTRSYPDGEYFGNITGFASILYGANKLECETAGYLDGSDDVFFTDKILASFKEDEQMRGNVVTSLDAGLQRTAYDALAAVSDSGAAVAIEPSTGRILAQVSVPGWDPNRISNADTDAAGVAYDELNDDESKPMVDKTVQEHYAPGSTFKTVVAAAFIENGHGDADSMVPAGNRYDPPNTERDITNSTDQCPQSELTLEEAFARSCNTTFSKICNEVLEPGEVTEIAEQFGFGESFRTPLTTPADSRTPANMDDPGIRAQACIGQNDVTETVLQNSIIAATVANDGVRMDPQLIDKVTNSEGETIKKVGESDNGRAVSSDTAAELRQLMRATVDRGTGGNAQISGYDSGGKTGTAEHWDSSGDPLPDHGWFIGWAGPDDGEPEVAVAVLLDSYGSGGSATATDIAGQLMQQYLQND